MIICKDICFEPENEIVFGECDENLFFNLIEFFKSEYYEIVESSQLVNGDSIYVMENEDSQIKFVKSYELNAIYLYLKRTNSISIKLLKKCPRCNSYNLLQRISYAIATPEEHYLVETGKLAYLPGTYDRIGIPCPNWKCTKCGLEWHNLNDFRKKGSKGSI